jgi:hypothetical protein
MTVQSRRRALAVLGSGLGLLAGATIPAVASARPDVAKAPPGLAGEITMLTTVPHSSQAMAIMTPASGKPDNGNVALIKKNGAWHKIAAPVVGGQSTSGGAIKAVAAGSNSTIWAGGAYAPSPTSRAPAIWRWTGKAWAAQTLTGLATGLNSIDAFSTEIDAMSASSPTNAWAVGKITDTSNEPTSLHWNGKAWSTVSIPLTKTNTGVNAPELTEVSTTSPTNAWAIELYQSDLYKVVHLVNGRWSVAKSIPQGAYLAEVATSSKHLTYVIETIFVSAEKRDSSILKFNGKTWSKVALPAADRHLSLMRVAVSGKSIWVIVQNFTAQTDTIIHSDGGKWTTELALPPSSWSLDTISAESSKQALAGGEDGGDQTYVTESNGSKWTAQSSK